MHLLLRELFKDTPPAMESGMKEEEKSPAPGGIQTHDLQITRGVLYSCATTAALWKAFLLQEIIVSDHYGVNLLPICSEWLARGLIIVIEFARVSFSAVTFVTQ